jgi:hypothetical protein
MTKAVIVAARIFFAMTLAGPHVTLRIVCLTQLRTIPYRARFNNQRLLSCKGHITWLASNRAF